MGTPAKTDQNEFSAPELQRIFTDVSPNSPFPELGDRRWRTHTDPLVWQHIEAVVERALSQPPPVIRASEIVAFSTTGDRDVFQRPYHERRTQIASLAAVLCRDASTPDFDERVLTELEDRLWQTCEETSWMLSAHLWNNGLSSELPPPDIHAVDLGAAQTAFTLGEVVSLTESMLHPEIVERVDYEIEQRVLRPYVYRNNFHWMESFHNWNIVCHTGICGAALYRAPRRYAPAIIAKALRFAPRFIDGFDAEGSSPEGVMVWNFGFGHLCMLNDLFERWSDGQVSMFVGKESKIAAMASFPRDMHLSDNLYVNFSDAERRTDITPFVVDYANRRLGLDLPLPPFRTLREHDYVLRHLFTQAPETLEYPHHPRTILYTGNQWVIVRSDESANPEITVAARGGHNGESHNHNDLGSFVLHARGETFIAELGRNRFTRDTFAGDRYAGLAYSSRGHSVPRIDGELQSPGEAFRAELLEHSFGLTDSIVLDLTRAYGPAAGVQRFLRRFAFTRSENRLVVLDKFSLSGDGEIEEVLWSFLQMEKTADDSFLVHGRRSTLRGTFVPVPERLSIDEVPNAVFSDTAYAIVAKFEVGKALEVSMRLDIDTGTGLDR